MQTASDKRQPFEPDHRVAAPIGEPMVTRDDSAQIMPAGFRLRQFLHSAGGRDDKLIGGQDQMPAEAFMRRRGGSGKQICKPTSLGSAGSKGIALQ